MPNQKKALPILVIERNLFTSKAWLSLNGIAPQVYFLFLCRKQMDKIGKKGHEKWICTNSREIIFTIRMAKNLYGFTQPRFTRAIDMLIEKGFIDIIKSGALLKESTIYGLSDRWQKYGTSEFKERKRIKCNVDRGFIKPKK